MKTLIALLFLCCALQAADTTHAPDSYEPIAKGYGWLSNLKRGEDIVHKLAAMSSEELRKVEVTAYRGERVAFIGSGAPPGGTNDLLTEGGFYLRVLTPSGKDLRPQSVWWEVIVCGKILQILPKNKIIVIEIDEKDWKIIQTG